MFGVVVQRSLCALRVSSDTEDDFIEFRFDQSTVDSERGLKAYMNTMAETGGTTSKH